MKKIYKNLESFKGFLPNFSYFFSSNLLTHFFSFFVIVYFARVYSPKEFGGGFAPVLDDPARLFQTIGPLVDVRKDHEAE